MKLSTYAGSVPLLQTLVVAGTSVLLSISVRSTRASVAVSLSTTVPAAPLALGLVVRVGRTSLTDGFPHTR